MAEWKYHDFETYAGATRVARLKQHITEVRAVINGPDISADGKMRNLTTLQQYLAEVTKRLDQLESSSSKRAGGITYVRPLPAGGSAAMDE